MSSMAMRAWFAFFGLFLWLGIYLTGFSQVHWILYIPAAASIFASVTGICPSMMVMNKLFKPKQAS